MDVPTGSMYFSFSRFNSRQESRAGGILGSMEKFERICSDVDVDGCVDEQDEEICKEHGKALAKTLSDTLARRLKFTSHHEIIPKSKERNQSS